ncbi:MAG TPA: AMP-binding protein [Novosphingobium sp.]|nr:AMP-binding protein [Novosphingobium sp.]
MATRRDIAGYSVRWDQDRADAAYAQGWWTRETLADSLRRAAAETPDRVLVVDGEVRLDCRTLHLRAASLAQALLARFAPGSVVSFMLPNWHEAAEIYLGATLAGMVAHPVMPSLRDRDLIFMLADVGSRMIFVPAELRGFDYRAMMDRIGPQFDASPEVVVLRGGPGDHTAYASLFGSPKGYPLPVQDADAVRMVLYTSGTTGSPKGVLHSHNSINALIRQLGRHWLAEPGDKFLVPSPIAHIGGSIYAFEMPLLLGTTAILMEKWDADHAVRLIDAERCTHTAGATPFLTQILESARRANTRLPSLKLFICGGASVPPSLIRGAADYFDNAIVTRVYGSTEVPVTTVGTIDRDDVTHAAETDGAPGIAEVRLVADDGVAGEEGEIRARGAQMLVGYLHPEDEATVFDDEGFYRSGDLARRIDGRFLVVSGRSKDIIIRKGENISPKEIEDILVDHPGIAEIAIVGVPDEKTGERACAVIVPREKSRPDVAALRAFLDAQGVATFKVPEQVDLRDSLPKNDAGKVLKHVLRAELKHTGREG